MMITGISYRTYRLPFVRPFSTAHGTLTAREGAILTLMTSEGVTGIGEVAPFPGLSEETLTEALTALEARIPRLRGMPLETALALLDSEALPASTRCGIEMALLDALDHSGRAVFPRVRSQVAVNATIGAQAVEDAVQAANQARRAGFSCVKLKVGVCKTVQQEIARVGAVRETLGSDIALRLDANEGWTFDKAREILTQCVPFDIQYVEQPLAAYDIENVCRLRHAVPIPLASDEAVRDIESARNILRHKAADVLVLKPQLTGGLRACQRIVQEAATHGVACVLTTTLESGVSVAATARLVASLPEITLACGLATSSLLVDDLIHEHLTVKNGVLTVPTGSGWGVMLDEALL
jgi:o-succinylbenzoate synthase